MRGKKPASVAMPPVFGLPPAIQKMSLKAGQRLRRGIGIGGLGIVDEQHVALAADLLHAMRKSGKRPQALLDRLRGEPQRERRAGRAGGVLRVVAAAQRADAAEMRDRLARSRPPPA